MCVDECISKQAQLILVSDDVKNMCILDLGEGSVVKKRNFRIFAGQLFFSSYFLPQNLYLDPNPDRTAEKKHEANAPI